MQKVEFSTEHIIKWCDEIVQSGKELSFNWDGGGDSGMFELLIDGEDVSYTFPEAEYIIYKLYYTLGYGSFAGEFSTVGHTTYDPNTKCFTGEDRYSQCESVMCNCAITISVPKDLWFDEVEYSFGEDYAPAVSFVIKNGFLTNRHEEVVTLLTETLDDGIDAVIDKFKMDTGNDDIVDYYQDDRIPRSWFKEEGDNLVYTIDRVFLSYQDVEVTEKCIDVNTL